MGWDMQPSRIVTVFQGLNFPISSSFGSWLLFWDGSGAAPLALGVPSPSPPIPNHGVQSPLQWVRGTFWGVQGGGISAATLPSPAQPEETGCAIQVVASACCEDQRAWLLPVDLAAPGAEEGARSLGQLVLPNTPWASTRDLFPGWNVFPKKTLTPSTTQDWQSPAPTGAQRRGKALSPSTCYLIFNPGAN